MFAKINSAGLQGIDGFAVVVEADVYNGLPGLVLSGSLSTETREAQSRVWNALKNCVGSVGSKKTVVNFSPAFVRKEGTGYDLAIAVAILCGNGMVDHRLFSDTAFLGELGLDGTIKGIRGVLSLAFAVKEMGCSRLIISDENVQEAVLVEGLEVIGCRNIREVIDVMRRIGYGEIIEGAACAEEVSEYYDEPVYETDFAEVHGQKYLKRAAEIAVSGMHNILMCGPAGTGKTMIAKCMPTIMPRLTREEDIEISKVYSICGLLPEGKPLLSRRPFRSPNHGVSEAAFSGGGTKVLPGEVSLATHGLLMMDELVLFPKSILSALLLPLEDRKVTVSRMHGSFVYPANFLMVASMNPCPCGYYPDRSKCKCTPAQIRAYTGRISRPLLQRIDLCAEANPVGVEELVERNSTQEESSAVIRERVERTHRIQLENRGMFNGRMGVKEVEKYCVLGTEEKEFVKEMFEIKDLSGRTYHKILRVARTIADMEESADIKTTHLMEAIEFRGMEDRMFGRNQG